MANLQQLFNQSLLVEITLFVLVAPQFFICAYILLKKAPRIKNNTLILLVVGLLALVDISYPLSRMFKHMAFSCLLNKMDDEATSNFKASSYFEGIYVASFQAAIWIFALKFWVLSIRLKVVSQKGNPESLRSIA